MNFAEKLLIVAENTPKVYEAGQKAGGGGCDVDHDALYNNGYTEGHTKGYTDGETAGYNTGYNKGYADGQSGGTGEQESVQNPLEYAKTVSYREVTFPANYELVVNAPILNSLYYMFYTTTGIKKITIKGNNNGSVIDFNTAFRGCNSVEIIDFTEFVAKVGNCNYAFGNCRKLHTIDGELDFAECTNTNNIFQNCEALKEIRLKANSLELSISFSASSLLSANSIQSIIDGLAKVETAQTITFHSSIVLTDEQKATISSKGWTLAQ